MSALPQVVRRDRLSAVFAAATNVPATENSEKAGIKLNSLLLCRDPQVLQTLRRLLEEMGVGVEVCSEAVFGMVMFSRRKFDAVIVDMELKGAGDVMKALRRSASNKNMVTFALIDGQASLTTAFEMGANFVVHKPISAERAKLTMRAANNLMRRDRRNLNRHNLQVLASLVFEGGQEIQAIVTDLSDTGMSVFLAEPPPGGSSVRLTLPLPGTRKTIEGWGEMIWVDAEGRTGIRFVQLPQISQKQLLAEWLKHFSSFGLHG
jgi:ActR/RegA family two-component response regulator